MTLTPAALVAATLASALVSPLPSAPAVLTSPLRIETLVTTETGDPLSGAEVSILRTDFSPVIGGRIAREQTARTSAAGRCVLTLPPRDPSRRGSVTVAAWAPGRARTALSVYPANASTEVGLTFSLAPSEAIRGSVVDDGGAPVADVEVLAISAGGIRSMAAARAGAEGEFLLEGLCSGEALFMVRPPGGPSMRIDHPVWAARGEVKLPLPPLTGIVTGQVVAWVSRQPQPGVHVRLHDVLQPGNARECVSDADGRFRFERLPLQQITVAIDRFGTTPVWLGPGQSTVDVTLTVPDVVVVTGQIVDATSEAPLPSVRLRLSLSGDERVSAEAAADASGHFTFPPLNLGPSAKIECLEPEYIFNAERPAMNFDPTAPEVLPLRFPVHRARPFVGMAMDSEGAPLSGVRMLVAAADQHLLMSLGTTDEQGHATAPMPLDWQGPFQLAGHRGDLIVLSRELPGSSSQGTATPTASMELAVQVIDSEGRPVEGARVDTWSRLTLFGERWPFALPERSGDDCPSSRDERFPDTSRSGITDSQGWAHIENVPRVATTVRITAHHPDGTSDHVTREIDLAAPNAAAQLTVTLEPAHIVTVHGRLLDPDGRPVAGAAVEWQPGSGHELTAATDSQGCFQFTGRAEMFNGMLNTRARGRREWLGAARWPWRGEEVFQFAPQIRLHGRLVGPGAENAGYFQLCVLRPASGEEGVWEPLEQALFRSPPPRFLWDDMLHTREMRGRRLRLVATVQSGQFASAELNVADVASQEITAPLMHLQPASSLRGRVLDPAGRPVAGAEVAWDRMPAGIGQQILDGVWSVRTESDGAFRLVNLPAGTWRFRVEVPGHPPQTVSVTLQGDTRHDITFTPQPSP